MLEQILDAAVRYYLRTRRGLKEPVSPEETVAYVEGAFVGAERERFLDRLALQPEAARAAADLVCFSKRALLRDSEERPDECAEADWEILRAQLAAAHSETEESSLALTLRAGWVKAPPGLSFFDRALERSGSFFKQASGKKAVVLLGVTTISFLAWRIVRKNRAPV